MDSSYFVSNYIKALARSVEHPAAPPVKGCTRAEMIFNGWFITELPNGLTKIVVVGHLNPKGDLPKALVN